MRRMRTTDCIAHRWIAFRARADARRGMTVRAYITTGASGSSFAPAAVRRKMRRQLPRDRLDALDHAALEIPGLEIGLHRRADFFPAGGADLRVDAAIGDDLDIAVGEQQIDQHAVVVGGVPDPQLRENIERALARRLIAEQRRAVERAFHHEADLAGMRGLARLDRLLDRRQHLRRKDAPHPPAMLEKMLADAPDAHATSSRSTSFPTRRRRRNCRHRR